MKRLLGLQTLFWSSAVVALVAQPGQATTATITGIQVNPTETGASIVLETEGGEIANVFTVNQGNTFQADITRTQLSLADGNTFRQANPAPGIAEVTLTPLDANSVRLTIQGTEQAPAGQVQITESDRLVLAVQTVGTPAQPTATAIPTDLETVPGPLTAPDSAIAQAEPTQEMTPAPEATPTEATPAATPTEETPEVMVPNPEVVIDGVPVPTPQTLTPPPFLPRAIAPPVGDIAVAESVVLSEEIDLGSTERIPKLVLRNAPAREVLSLLARAAGLNLVFTSGATEPGGESLEGTSNDGPTVTLDIENESVQDVFNHVLRVSGLQANRVGRSIYVGVLLPDGARSLTSRTLRLNQVDAIDAAGFLAALGADASQIVTRDEVEVITIESPVENAPPIQRIREFTSTEIEQLSLDVDETSLIAQPLAGLQAVADGRLNSLTLVGEPRLINLATQYVARLDLRQRQVAVNVKILDVNLSAIDRFGVSFSFGVGDTSLVNTGGAGVVNFGNTTPSSVASPVNPSGIAAIGLPSAFFVPSQFLLQLQAQITNGNAKILTDPTLVVQEGQAASVNLIQEVVTNVETQISTSTPPVITTTVEKGEAGLILGLQVERIDDNGFISLNVSPRVSSIGGTTNIVVGSSGSQQIVLLNTREVSSGTIRLRDGQSLILTGIIQEQERAEVSKVPILGDLPILGALFRSTTRTNQRNEVIVILTPQILDDSDQSVFGYTYTPSEEVQEILDQNR